MKKTYDPLSIEGPLYEWWEKKGYFKAKNDESRDSFCIMLPPPNVTGSLHMGHAFQHAIMDILIRYQRMLGKNTLWQVGTDHAGIATQMIVERKIAIEEGKTRFDYIRSEFVNKIWKWKAESSNSISYQMRRLGNSVDWERERFSMDDDFSQAVKEAFVRLYKENLIYRAKRLVNWDPKLQTAISDLEVVNRKSKGFIWYIRYPLADGEKTKDGKNFLVLATTRPETLLGDTGVAVNPEDSRYRCLIGKFVILPIVNRRIPIISDKNVSIRKGTGCVKITPAHDFFDNEIAHRHKLPMINILTLNGNIRRNAEVFDFKGNKSSSHSTEIPIEFQKLDRFAARKAIVSALDSLNLLEQTKLHCFILPHSERSGEIIEPMLVSQWYLRVSKMAKTAIEAVENGDIRFIPSQYKNMYFSWMYNIQDWCISRQLWWGHRIPVWYGEQRNIYVGRSEEEVRRRNNLSEDIVLHQEEDVLDTWFSSSLWTFSTLGWPKSTGALRQFHPTNVIVSGFDIVFFWIARMIMMTMHFIKDKNGNPQVPFKIVYVTGLVCDEEGQKMSKSNGNVIDPIDIVNGISLTKLLEKRTKNMLQPQLENKIRRYTKKYFPNGINSFGADALRLTLTSLASGSRSIHWSMKGLEGYRNFCNKLWNASRFVLMNTENQNCGFNKDRKVLSLADNWILGKFNQTVKMYRKALDTFRFDIAVDILYEFTWNQFCDWYLELIKPTINRSSEVELRGTRYVLVTVLESLLRLAHPIIPFITEFIWQRIKTVAGINESTIMLQPFPDFEESLINEEVFSEIEWLKKVIVTIRHVRAEMNIGPRKLIKVIFRNCENKIIHRVNKNKHLLESVAHIENISLISDDNGIELPFITRNIEGTELLIPTEDLLNKKIELERLKKEVEKIEEKIRKIKDKLEDNNFITCAPEPIITVERKKLMKCFEEKSKLIKQQSIISTL